MLSFFKKECHEWFSLLLSKSKRFGLEQNCIFLHVFDLFSLLFPFYAQERIVWSFLKSDGSDSLLSLHIYKRATVSEELSSLFWIAILLFSSQKTSYSLKNPKSELPTLLYWISLRWTFYCFTTFFHLTNPSGPLNDVLKYFRIWS